MPLLSILFAIVAQVTPPPPPPVLQTPQPSPSASLSPVPSPSPSAAPLAVAPAVLDHLYPSQSRVLTIENGSAPFTVSVDVPLVTVAIDQAARTLTVTSATQTGRATIALTDATGASVQIPVRVAVDAGSVPAALTLRVTGTQLDTQWLALQIQKQLARAVQLQPGAGTQIGTFTLPSALGPGASASVPVPVTIAGGDRYFDVNGSSSVSLQNVAADPFSPPLLFYDDDPEKLDAAGVLFRGTVSSSAPTRLYYYHENTTDPHDLAVVFSSASAQPSSVQLIDASAGPNIDVMSVGHAVSRSFLVQKTLNEGIIIDVDALHPYVAEHFAMNRLEGAAGSIGIHVLDGGPVNVTVLALPPGVADAQIPSYLTLPQLPGDGHHRTGAFSLVNYGTDTLTYVAPGPDVNVQYGTHSPPAAAPVNDPVPAGHDYGDYGVLHSLDFEINNPLDQPQTLYLYERPMGGAVRSSFLVNGTLVQLGCARASERYQIGDPITVEPHALLRVPVQTMTDGGSNYPLEVGISAAPPFPTVPAINAPNGCFPKIPVPQPTG